MKINIFLLLFLLAFANLNAHTTSDDSDGRCGTARIFENIHSMKGKSARTSFEKNTSCTPENYYNHVESKKTIHFQIFYTLNGPHSTTQEFVDTLAIYLEKAYDFHTTKLNMLPPKGVAQSYHYQKETPSNLYAVEVVDIDLLRDGYQLFQNTTCGGCYGITYPTSNDNSELTQLFIDNDFKYIDAKSSISYMDDENKTCSYYKSTTALVNNYSGVDYSKNWAEAIRITVFHELYHACQLRYLDMNQYWTFWFEASATGVEKITNTNIKDYIGFISNAFHLQNTDLNNAFGKEAYGLGILYLYLYNHFKKDFDHYIWESFKKNPDKTLNYHLEKHLKNNKKNADSLFHDFITKLTFSGKKSKMLSTNEWIDEHQNLWPEIFTEKKEQFIVNLPLFSYKYYWGGFPNMDSFKGMASAAVLTNNNAEIIPITTTNKADYIYSNIKKADSIIWIFSRFANDDFIQTIITDSTLRAYPTPWREGKLCFTPLPREKKIVEIRNRRGAIVLREPYDSITHCIDETKIKQKMAPGIYWFRAGNKGKMKKFIITY